MTVSRYRLTAMGKIGALLFVAPTPIAIYYVQPAQLNEGAAAFQRRLSAMGATSDVFTPSITLLTVLATASLIGLVMLFVGREIVTSEA